MKAKLANYLFNTIPGAVLCAIGLIVAIFLIGWGVSSLPGLLPAIVVVVLLLAGSGCFLVGFLRINSKTTDRPD